MSSWVFESIKNYCQFLFYQCFKRSKKETGELVVSCFSWEEFNQLGSLDYELSSK